MTTCTRGRRALCAALLWPTLWLLGAVRLWAGEPVIPDFFDDYYRNEVPVAGPGVVTGISAGALDARIDPSQLIVYLPAETPETKLCIDVLSRDGRYGASIAHDVSGRPSGPFRLLIQTKYREVLKRYRVGQLAVLARLQASGEDCRRTGHTYLLSSWAGVEEADGFHIFVNSGGAFDVYLNGLGKAPWPGMPCQAFDEPRTAYDVFCRVPPDHPEQLGSLEILRGRFGTYAKPTETPISLP